MQIRPGMIHIPLTNVSHCLAQFTDTYMYSAAGAGTAGQAMTGSLLLEEIQTSVCKF